MMTTKLSDTFVAIMFLAVVSMTFFPGTAEGFVAGIKGKRNPLANDQPAISHRSFTNQVICLVSCVQ